MFDILATLTTIFENLGVLTVTVYGFWLYHFSQNVKVTSFGRTCSLFFGNSLNCSIYNKTMSPKTICNISVVFDNKYLMIIKTYEEPILLEPFHAYNIIGDKYSRSENIPQYSDIYFRLKTPEKTIFVPYKGKIINKTGLEVIEKSSYAYNDIVISDMVKYVLMYRYKGCNKADTIYITKDGMMNRNFKGCNVLPKDIVEDENKFKDFWEKQFADQDVSFIIDKIKY